MSKPKKASDEAGKTPPGTEHVPTGPLPGAGGSYVRLPDGSLRPEGGETEAAPAAAQTETKGEA